MIVILDIQSSSTTKVYPQFPQFRIVSLQKENNSYITDINDFCHSNVLLSFLSLHSANSSNTLQTREMDSHFTKQIADCRKLPPLLQHVSEPRKTGDSYYRLEIGTGYLFIYLFFKNSEAIPSTRRLGKYLE